MVQIPKPLRTMEFGRGLVLLWSCWTVWPGLAFLIFIPGISPTKYSLEILLAYDVIWPHGHLQIMQYISLPGELFVPIHNDDVSPYLWSSQLGSTSSVSVCDMQ